MGAPCTENRRFENIESTIEELKQNQQINHADIVMLRENQSETKIYVKQIFERLDDIKALFTTGTSEHNKIWLVVVLELIKAIGIVAAIVGGLKLLS